MSHPLYVAFIWHQHQPLYKSRDLQSGNAAQYQLPWVRLHGIKDYLDLILVLEKYPKLHQTVNLVPSLILQIEDYVQGVAMDPYLALTLTPENQLHQHQKQYIIEYFFDANYHNLIAPHPRYAQLYHQREDKGKVWCQEHWTDQEYSDLLAWHNLAWFDPIFWDDAEIATWLSQGKNYTLSDRQRIYSKQRSILKRIIPEHRCLQDIGQIEITTTPYTHPILPLLADTNSAQVALPQINLPQSRFVWPQDIPRHLRKAWDLYVDRFGKTPQGLWPSEQSVSPEILSHIAKQGFNWICSDEAVLGWTLQHPFHRNHAGNLYEPELLYRPYRLTTPYEDISIVFRDHRLSDLIGFTYGSMDPYQAAKDLIGHLDAIAYSLKNRKPHSPSTLQEPWLVTIALDGENCWEYYPKDGLPFLETLYQMLSHHSQIKLVTVSEFLQKFPPTVTIPATRLHSGSWIDANFTTWIGDPVKNRAWDLLSQARQLLAQHPEATEENNPEVWEALYAAEGSDWFWWFGEGHTSHQDAMFDQLFRSHLGAIYRGLNHPIPSALQKPLESHQVKKNHLPMGFIHPTIDGVGDEREWEKAGRVEIGGARGTMHQSSSVQRFFYGWDHLGFYLRFDLKAGIKPGEGLPKELHLLWFLPNTLVYVSPAPIFALPDYSPLNYLYHHHLGIDLVRHSFWFQQAAEGHSWHYRHCNAQIAQGSSIELTVPWNDLHVNPDQSIQLIAILADEGEYQMAIPHNNLITLQVP